MVQITQICRSIKESLLKRLILAFLLVWHLSFNALFANSGSYIAGQFAEKEGIFRNASYYYIDLISRGGNRERNYKEKYNLFGVVR